MTMRVRTATACLATGLVTGLIMAGVQDTRADEGGVSFWLPGMMGSLAALPGTPGWGWTTFYYHSTVDAGASKAFPRGGRIEAGLDAKSNLIAFGPSYTFATPIFGAQAAINVLGIAGHIDAAIDATLTGPRGNTISGTRSDERWGFGDVIPMVSLKWNQGVHNYMWYGTGNLPIGAYDPSRLANFGLGHGSIDSGFGYTYFNPHTGWEASAVLGFTYNFKNPDTDYQNGIDGHLDWAVSKFVTQQMHIGVVGYVFQQVTGDSGSGATLGDFRSRVAGIGPQVGFMFPVGDLQGYLNVKAYREFGAENRPEGWNAWLTFVISQAPPKPASPAHLVRK